MNKGRKESPRVCRPPPIAILSRLQPDGGVPGDWPVVQRSAINCPAFMSNGKVKLRREFTKNGKNMLFKVLYSIDVSSVVPPTTALRQVHLAKAIPLCM